MRDSITLGLSQIIQAHPFWEILPDQSISVFIASPLPRMMWGSKVELEAMSLLHLFVSMELTAVVSSDGSEPFRMPFNELAQASIGLLHGPGRQLANHHITRLAIHQREDACSILSHDRVDLPVADSGAVGGTVRPSRQRTLACQPAPAVIGPISLPALLAAFAAKQLIQLSSALFVRQQIPVNRLMADCKFAHSEQITGNLIRAVIHL